MARQGVNPNPTNLPLSLVLYDMNDEVMEVQKVPETIEVDGPDVNWGFGRKKNIKSNFIIISADINIDIGDVVEQSIKEKDRSSSKRRHDLAKENARLEKRISQLEKKNMFTDQSLTEVFEQMKGIK